MNEWNVQLGRAEWKGVFEHAQNAQIQIAYAQNPIWAFALY